ncbi:hypothetical protein GPECTOR_302g824 [Gonium pectorale]|uniref:Flavanone 4-reductase n=1 Tax=Gonium pectorale TaxID=33097 RepID=A0A150FVU2_GONPE|nr:hypothetical protein GPECTOR_302g824 [Gonium pectorale]|eukprot:KXZ41729.1 hypothetical protein GPECTOR_302g824 [Gonium pectorale]
MEGSTVLLTGVTGFNADIRSEEELASAADGAHYVFHVASPFVITAEDPARDIVAPAIHDCHAKQEPAAGPGQRYSEEDWNTLSTLEAEPYWVSKVEAERTAWRLAEELGLPLVTILPNFVMGPVLAPEAAGGTSVGFFKAFVEARADKPPPSGSWTFVDVRDVAAAHLLAATVPGAAGRRYIVSRSKAASSRTVTDILRTGVPELAGMPEGEPAAEEERIDSSRSECELGLVYTPLQQTLVDMAVSLIRLGIASPAGAAADAAAAAP